MMKRKSISKKLKDEILKESGNKCAVCGAHLFIQLHHIIPIFLGGTSTKDNIIVLCPTCHDSVERSNIPPSTLTKIKDNWMKNQIQGREEIIKLSKEIHKNQEKLTLTDTFLLQQAALMHDLGHWISALNKYDEFDSRIEKIVSEIEAISDEDKFIKHILDPLFNVLGFEGVTVLHHTGTQEKGKDMVFFDRDKFGNFTFYAVVVSAKKIHANSSKTHDSGHYNKIIEQVSKCFHFPYCDPNLKGSFYIDKVIIACASTITDEAMEAFRIWEDDKRRHLIYLSGPKIAGMRLKQSVKSSGNNA